jgi:hypothetical protein
MAKVPSLPSNGQPIDTQYIYDIVSSLIDINKEIASSGSSNVQDLPAQKTSNLKIQARTINAVSAAKKVSKTSSETGTLTFKTAFTQVPVVTATLVSRSSTTVKANLTITAVNTTTVSYKIDFDTNGFTTLDLNVIAIGV